MKRKELDGRARTAITTRRILDFLLARKVLGWRQNTQGVPVHREGRVVGFRPAGRVGIPDIMGILPDGGRTLCVEVKTGKDRLRPEQEGFHEQARWCGAVVLVVKDFDDFLRQWNEIFNQNK